MADDFNLSRNATAQLVFKDRDGNEHVGVAPARAFPITAPREEIAILSREGNELEWIPKLDDLPEEIRQLVEEELDGREFMPEILSVRSVTGYATPCTWLVETDRGETELLLKAEEDIRRLPGTALLIVDGRGIQFLIRNPLALDSISRKILNCFL